MRISLHRYEENPNPRGRMAGIKLSNGSRPPASPLQQGYSPIGSPHRPGSRGDTADR